MSLVLSHDVFAARGDLWNAHPEREAHSAGPIVRQIEGPSWRDVELDWRVEGYGPDGQPAKAQARPVVRTPKGCAHERTRLCVEMRNENAPKYRPPEYRCLLPEVHVVPSDARMPTADDLARGKRQRAAVKARMTRAQNRLKAERQEVWNILLSL